MNQKRRKIYKKIRGNYYSLLYQNGSITIERSSDKETGTDRVEIPEECLSDLYSLIRFHVTGDE